MKSILSRGVIAAVAMALFAVGCAAQVSPATPAVADTTSPPAAPAKSVPHAWPAPTALEVQTGIQVAQVGVTAQGGLVDVRFKVLDAAKAKALLGNPSNAPMLVTGDQPPLHPPHHALKGAKFAPGQVFYILYPNSRGAVKPGVEVTVAMGDARLGPIKAQ